MSACHEMVVKPTNIEYFMWGKSDNKLKSSTSAINVMIICSISNHHLLDLRRRNLSANRIRHSTTNTTLWRKFHQLCTLIRLLCCCKSFTKLEMFTSKKIKSSFLLSVMGLLSETCPVLFNFEYVLLKWHPKLF